ncbi:Rho GTPase-activating protein 6 [Triplophysa tibetana]|uniref:Rho GTPase-activating protein 6 n=1 Tax=Triplophysa tibetana TaxID=1572043 RepID=A0A5A9PSD8_9TELE|nr:Rho GTPase-activating protein 6 [Triplophysa tibetana]
MVLFYMGSDKHSSTLMQHEDPVHQDMQFYYMCEVSEEIAHIYRLSDIPACRGGLAILRSVFPVGRYPLGSEQTLWLLRRTYYKCECTQGKCKSHGEHTWTTMLGQSLRLQPVPIQSLSELERARLQEVALYHLEKRHLDFKISIPKENRKRRKSLRRKFDSFSKEKKDRDVAPQAFGIPLAQVIANDRAHKQRQDALKESRRDCLDLEASVLHFRAEKWQHNGNRTMSSTALSHGAASSPALEVQIKPVSSVFMDNTSRTHRRGGLSVDSISDLVESQSRLLEALQLSHPNELEMKKASAGLTQAKLSLNPIYRQVPRVVERCCNHIQAYGLQTLGIFRVGSSKKRVRQLRNDFNSGIDAVLDEEHSVHDVAALLKEFLREMPDPLLPRELYRAFLHANLLRGSDQLTYLQQLLYLLPPCYCDTLLRLLTLLHTVQQNAHDSTGPDQQEISGNKMTAANLAVIFGPNLLQKERGSERELSPQALGIEDSTAVISVTLLLIQNHKHLFMVSAELQQEVLMSLIQTDPDIIDYLLRRKVRDKQVSLDFVGQSSEDLSSLEPLFPDSSSIGSLNSDVFLNVLHLNTNRDRSSEAPPKSIGQIRQFHSHHNLLCLAQPSVNAQSDERQLRDQRQAASRQTWSGERLYSGLGQKDSDSQPQSPVEKRVWVRQSSNASSTTSDDSKPPSNFWDFFTGKVSGSETIV